MKTILITGSNSGLGLKFSEFYAGRSGFKTLLFYHDLKDNLGPFLEKQYTTIHKYDFTKSIDIKIDEVDFIIHCASIPPNFKKIQSLTSEDTALVGNFISGQTHFFKQIAPKINNGGKVVFILSQIVSGIPPSRMSSYAITKYATLGLMMCMAVELKDRKINVNSISPGMMDSKMTNLYPEKLVEITKEKYMNKTLISATEIIDLASFLFSESANNITGQNVVVSAGGFLG